MNKWLELVMAWFVGGFLGRLLAISLTDWLGLASIWAWLGVPVGAGIGWALVDFRHFAFALRHEYRWTKRPELISAIGEALSEARSVLREDWEEFRSDGMRWRILFGVSGGLFCAMWIIPAVILGGISYEQCLMVNHLTDTASLAVACVAFIVFIVAGVYAIAGTIHLANKLNWIKVLYSSYGGVKGDAIECSIFLLLCNPLSICLFWVLVACGYALKVCWDLALLSARILWKAIQMVNSSNRTLALTGVATGLIISQIGGYNPLVCGVVCVATGFVQKLVLLAIELVVVLVRSRRVIS